MVSSRVHAHDALASARLTLERDVHIAYANVLAEAESVKLAIEQEQLAKSVLKAVSKRVEAAADSEIQRSKADVAYAMSVIARQQEQQQLQPEVETVTLAVVGRTLVLVQAYESSVGNFG